MADIASPYVLVFSPSSQRCYSDATGKRKYFNAQLYQQRMSSRLDAVQESGTVKMADRVKELQSKGIDIISFSIGEPDFPTPQHITDAAISALREGFTKYTPSAGILELRQAIAEKLRNENGIEAQPSEIVVTPAKHAIFMTIFALVNRGEEVLLPDPGWVSYEPMVRMAEAQPVAVKADEETGFRITPEAVRDKISSNTRMIVLKSPGNPSGSVATREDIEGIAELAREHNILILSDEIYEKIVYGCTNYSPGAIAPDNTITVNGFSKTYSMTGWRLGYLHARKRYIENILKVQTHTVTCATSFAQKAGVAALRGPQDTVSYMVGEFRKRRDLVVQKLRSMPGIEVNEPRGAFYVFPRYHYNMNSEKMAEYLLEKAHVAVTPGISFGAAGEGHFRISYATSIEKLNRGLESMHAALESL
jgi:aspartate aminotransferase